MFERDVQGLLPSMVEEIEVDTESNNHRITIFEIGAETIALQFFKRHNDEFGIIFRNELQRALSK